MGEDKHWNSVREAWIESKGAKSWAEAVSRASREVSLVMYDGVPLFVTARPSLIAAIKQIEGYSTIGLMMCDSASDFEPPYTVEPICEKWARDQLDELAEALKGEQSDG